MAAARIATKTLGSGRAIPVLGLGVYQSEPGAETYNAVLSALQMGYRHIDTAQFYRNEADVGKAIRDSGIPREEIFVTSKHFAQKWSYDDALAIVKESVNKVGSGYIDLYLLHAPGQPEGRADAWRALEDAQSQGLLRDIGVSNYGQAHLEALSETWRVKPAVNQIELHPWLTREELCKYCAEQGIHLEAYSPLARAQKMDNATLNEIAQQTKATPAQVLIAWSLAKDFITIPKSVKPQRLQENLDAYNVKLSEAQVAALDALDEYFVTGWDPIKQHPVRSSL
jgi:methylglyoxal/glyoxal reductase